jgi:hypothetical protein
LNFNIHFDFHLFSFKLFHCNMTAPVTLNAAFVWLGFSNDAAEMLADATKEALDIEAFQYFDDKGIKTLCATLRKPGGTVDAPVAGGGGIIIQIPIPTQNTQNTKSNSKEYEAPALALWMKCVETTIKYIALH